MNPKQADKHSTPTSPADADDERRHAEAVARGKMGAAKRWGSRESTRFCKVYAGDVEAVRRLAGKTWADKLRALLHAAKPDAAAVPSSTSGEADAAAPVRALAVVVRFE